MSNLSLSRNGSRQIGSKQIGSKQIGSSFELVDDRYLTADTFRRLPWEAASDITYVESGRQAMAVVEAELRSQGHTQLHVPSYLCDSMISPFQRNGWTLEQLPVDRDLAVSPADLLARVSSGVLLHAPYFGRQDSPAMHDALDAVRRQGVVVVVDETHRVFSDPSPVADIRVASLRKSLPLYDGGYVAGLADMGLGDVGLADIDLAGPLPRHFKGSLQGSVQGSPSESEAAVLRRAAMHSKSDDNQAYRALFAEAEHATEARTQPARMSEASRSLLQRLDLGLIRTTREDNSTVLSEALGRSDRYRVINPPAPDLLPFHLVIDTDDVPGLQRYLAGQRIYCPVHWPASELLPRTGSWPSRYISLPVDHRYSEPDMLRMASCITAFFGKPPTGAAA
jgi:hypothetical protein